jgi:uncharacterized membrane protein
MKPTQRYLVIGIVLPVLVAVVAAWAVVWRVDRDMAAIDGARLHGADTVVYALWGARAAELQARAEALGNDPAFVDYVAQSMLPNAQLGGTVDKASISDLLTERRKGYDVAMVLDPQGMPVATSGVLLRDPAGIRHDPLVQRALATVAPAEGAWIDNDKLFWVTAMPMTRGAAVQGVLVGATQVDGGFVATVAKALGVHVGLYVQDGRTTRLIASSDQASDLGQAMARAPAPLTDASHELDIDARDGRHRGWMLPIPASSGKVAMLLAAPRGRGAGAIPAEAWPYLGGLAALLALSLATVWVRYVRTYQPLQALIVDIGRASIAGRLVPLRRGSAVVRALWNAANDVLLRAHREHGSRRIDLYQREQPHAERPAHAGAHELVTGKVAEHAAQQGGAAK